MKSFSSVLLACAALGAARRVESAVTAQEGSAVSANCLDDFNIARERAKLEPFTAEEQDDKKMPITQKDYIAAICKAIQQGTPVEKTPANYARTGTYAYAPQTDSTDGCSAAVSFWKEAHVNFEDLPPEYNDDSAAGVYGDSQNTSLVALYNPQGGATIDCAYITCPVSTTSTTTKPTSTTVTTPQPTASSSAQTSAPPPEPTTDLHSEGLGAQGRNSEAKPTTSPVPEGEEAQNQRNNGASIRRLSTSTETVTGLVCLTNPAALVKGQKPFSEEVWKNVKKAIENSASSSMQSPLLATALLLLTSFIIF